jgi:hypothetical protein
MRDCTRNVVARRHSTLKSVPKAPLMLILALILVAAAGIAMPAPTSAAIAQRGTATTGTTSSTSLTISKPAGVVAGDVILVNIAQVGNNSSNPTSTGWTVVAGANLGGGTARRGTVLYRVADGTEGSAFTFTLGSGTSGAVGSIVAFSGVDTSGATPFDVTPGAILVANSSAAGADAITTASANAAVVMFAMAANSAPTWSGWTTTSPGALTELYDSRKTTGDRASVGAAWAVKPSAGDTGAGAATLSSRERNGGLLIALKPPGNPVPATTSISPSAKTVGDTDFTLTVDGSSFVGTSVVRLDGADRVTAYVSSTQLTATIPATDLETAGSKAITVFNPTPGGGTSNAQTLTVEKATPAITWANPADIVYGTPLSSTELCATASVPGTFVYTPGAGVVLLAGNGQTLHVDFTPTDTANYNTASKDVTINVSVATLTITANDHGKTYGDTVTFAGTEFAAVGLANGDTVTSVTLTSAGTGASATVGSYPIAPSAASGTGLSNYSVSYVNGLLTVSTKTLTITANDGSKAYGDTVTFAGTEFATAGLVNGDTVDSVTLTSDGAPAGAAVGTYPIVPSAAVGTGLANYDITYISGILTISSSAPSVTSVSPTMGRQGQTLPVAITGTNLTGASSVSFGAGTTVTGYTVDSATRISATVSVDGAAAIGIRDVSVTTPGGTATKAGAFTVNPPLAVPAAWSATTYGANHLYSVWGTSASDIFAVGNSGVILHFDGSSLSTMTSGTTRYLRGVWGSSASDVFVVGTLGTIRHYDGVAWTSMDSGTTSDLHGIWGTSPSDVFAVGVGGIILHYDGSTWSPMSSGSTNWLRAVWGTSGSDVFVVGNSGTILHYDGSAWTLVTSGTSGNLCGIWGSSSSDVFVVGASGITLHYNGSAWAVMASGTTNTLYGVWGTSNSDVFAVGYAGAIRHYNGSAWGAMTSGTTNTLLGVWGTSSTEVVAVGYSGSILYYHQYEAPAVLGTNPSQGSQGTTMNVVITGVNFAGATSVSLGSGITVNSITVNSITQITANISIGGSATVGARDVLVAAPGGSALKAGAFTVCPPVTPAWIAMMSGSTAHLYGIWGSSASDVFAVGNSGVILRYDGSTWTAMTSGSTRYLRGIWGSSASDIFVVGTGGTILYYDGVAWGTMTSGTTNDLHAVWGNSASDVFAVGVNGTILHYDGSAWTPMTSGTTSWLRAVWGTSGSDVFAMGDSGVILHYDGSAWSPMTSGTTRNLCGVWGISGSDVFTVGASGIVLHYDGSSWSTMTSGTTNTLYAVWGGNGSDVYAVGYQGTIRHYDGSSWSGGISGTTNTLLSIWGTSSTNAFTIGHSGTILRHHEYPAPAVSLVGPSQGTRGTTMNVTITGANFTGATLVSFGAGITVNSFIVGNDTQITVNITIDGSAATGARDVSVTTPGGTATGTGAFTVIS